MIIEKPWGKEIVWAHTDKYVGKILEINQGHQLSLQHHEIKDETIYILEGSMRLIYGDNLDSLSEIEMDVGDTFHIKPMTIHRMIALTDCRILEASTPELDDIVRHQDEYGRIK